MRLHTQRPTQHTLLADSHYALGGFSDDRPLNWKMRDPERTPRPKRPPWKLETSIWAPRKSGATACDAKDFYDTVESKGQKGMKMMLKETIDNCLSLEEVSLFHKHPKAFADGFDASAEEPPLPEDGGVAAKVS